MPPNVLLIALDTQRSDHLSCYGYPKPTTPNIDQLAERGTLFRNFYAVGNCTHPGFTALFTGLSPESSGIVSHWTRVELPERVPTMAELFARAGYFTAAIDNLYDAWAPRGYPYYPWFRRAYEYYMYPTAESWYRSAALVTEHTIEWVRSRPAEPFFLFVHYWQPHAPYNKAPEEFRRFYDGDDPCDPRLDVMPPSVKRSVERVFGRPITDPAYGVAAYDAEVAYVDYAVGTLLDAMERDGLTDETLVLVTADHGEIMWPPRLGAGRLWCFSHIGLSEGCLRVPLIVAGPGVQRGIVEENAQLVDVLPTLVEWCGLEPTAFDGRSLAPALSGGSISSRDPIFASENTYQKQRSVRQGRWKYTRMEEVLSSMPARGLFDLEQDPLETENLADARPDRAAELDAVLNEYVVRSTEGRPDPIRAQPITQRPWERPRAPDHARSGRG